MSQLKMGTKDGRTRFRPGDWIEGGAGWELSQPAKCIEVRLFWYTKGKGIEDVEVVDTMRLENPELQGARPFRFQAPNGPYSFSGKLVSLQWALELVVEPGEHSARQDIVISSTGDAVDLTAFNSPQNEMHS